MEHESRPMTAPFDTVMVRFTAAKSAEIEMHAQSLLTEQMSLRDLRNARGKTRPHLALRLNSLRRRCRGSGGSRTCCLRPSIGWCTRWATGCASWRNCQAKRL